METNENLIIRQEMAGDFFEVENLVREAFWNIYRPGCVEHIVLHNFRKSQEFLKELSFVLIKDNKIIGHIMYAKTKVIFDNQKQTQVLELGPVAILPQEQKKGYGKILIETTIQKAMDLGYGAICLTGDPDYYSKFGFKSGKDFNIYYNGVPREEDAPFFMVKLLRENYFQNQTGTFEDAQGYSNFNEEELEKFDKKFPPKEKKVLETQIF